MAALHAIDPVAELPSLVARLPPGTVSTHPGELGSRTRDRWAEAMLRDRRGDRVPPGAVVAFPRATAEVSTILAWAQRTGVPVVARGGGTGLSGGAEAIKRGLMLDLSRMKRILSLDEVSQAAEVEAGVAGAELEAALAPKGLTCGHDPAMPDLATVGGWVATWAEGSLSGGLGGLAERVLGLTCVLAGGRILRLPARATWGAGPDLRRLFIGSEGALGVLTEVTLALSRARGLIWETFRPHSFDAGLSLVREVVQRDHRPLVARLLDDREVEASFGPFTPRVPLVILGFDASAPAGDAVRFEVRGLARGSGARMAERALAEHWWEHRHDGAAWQEAMMGSQRPEGEGVLIDWLDVAALWRRIPRLYEEVRGVLLDHARDVRCSLIDPTPWGGALRFTFVLRDADDAAVGGRYRAAWDTAVTAALEAGGGLAHHGIGLRSLHLLADELGEEATAVLAAIKSGLDPTGIMNPGKLLPPEEPSGGGRPDA